MTTTMQKSMIVFLVLTVAGVYCQNKDWHVGADRVNPSGTVVHGHANIPFHRGSDGRLYGNVHGSRVFGGPYNGARTLGGGLNYQHNSGLHGGVDATHTRGMGTSYGATVGGSRPLGPGTFSVDGSAVRGPGSSKVNGQIMGTYNIPF